MKYRDNSETVIRDEPAADGYISFRILAEDRPFMQIIGDADKRRLLVHGYNNDENRFVLLSAELLQDIVDLMKGNK